MTEAGVGELRPDLGVGKAVMKSTPDDRPVEPVDGVQLLRSYLLHCR